MKRGLDILIATLALVISIPVFLIVAMAIKLDSRGPVLFRQTRVGLAGKEFDMLKFRTMVEDAQSIGGFRTKTGDPRITRVGRFLRRTSVDELPQLWNVLLGDMSIIGPRPDVPAQEGDYVRSDWELRHSVRPGLTGLAQASKRSSATPEERLALDLEYVRNVSFSYDVRILAKTLRQVISKGGN